MGCLILLFQFFCIIHFFNLHFQVVCLSSFSTSSSEKLYPLDQCSALLEFKNMFSIDRFASSECDFHHGVKSYPKTVSWKKSKSCCTWDGVMCDNTLKGHVIGLDLSCSWLRGSIHPNTTLLFLPHLQKLNLAYNNFTLSSISSEFGKFSSLTHLNLSNALFSGQIPSEVSYLSKLISMDFSRNSHLIIGRSTWRRLVQNLRELRELILDEVDMGSIVLKSFVNFSSSLTSLSLNHCKLQGKMPADIFRFKNLQELRLSENKNLSGYFPKSKWSRSFRFLDLSSTNFSGELPDSIGNLKHLKELHLCGCNFTGSIPPSLGNLTKITTLNLSKNNLTGKIPSSLSNLEQLTHFNLSQNNLEGQIPNVFSKLRNLVSLSLSLNNFSGHVDFNMFLKLQNLQRLDLSHNSLALTNKENVNFTLPNLTSLSLSSCKLKEFPKFIKGRETFLWLDLSNNQIHGKVPKWVMDVGKDSLYHLNLSANNLTSMNQIQWKSLVNFDLCLNLLQGQLLVPPISHHMQIFAMSHNNFSGEIPPSVCNMSSLLILDLSNNNLNGKVPQCLGNFSHKLSVLNLRVNNFNGTIPDTFSEYNHLRNINFNSNEFEGPLPKSLVNCKMLEILDLGNNKLSDSFPHFLATLPHLQVLVLRFNRFRGLICNPKARNSFPKLRIIDLSHNKFSGKLPTKYFEGFQALMNDDENQVKLKYMGDKYYQDSMMVTMKGLDVELVKILTVFTTIDFSDNHFRGEIFGSIGKLKCLRGLNFSHNGLSGWIPPSLGSLSNLEWLDLSSNKLIGEIPIQLADITSLSVLNLSQNQLVGSIPRGRQFNTFQNDSFNGNLRLCGFPLSKTCGEDDKVQQPPPPPATPQDDDEPGNGFGWKVVVMGYACGIVLGMVIGYVVFTTGKPEWLVKMVDDRRYGGNPRRQKPRSRRRGR